MNHLVDLINRYAASSGLRVDIREWLMLLELDPDTAARVVTHLAVLAAEDDALRIAGHGGTALTAAHRPIGPDNDTDGLARRQLAGFTARLTSANDRAWTAWNQILIPLLRDACVLTDTPSRVGVPIARRWIDTTVRLPGLPTTYPAQVAQRRQHRCAPIVRFTLEVCRAIAADIDTHDPHQHLHLRPAVLVDHDEAIVVAAADSLDTAWAADAAVLQPDSDGRWPLGSRTWPWSHTVEPPRNHMRHRPARRPGNDVRHRAATPAS